MCRLQVTSDVTVAESEVAGDVLKEHPLWLALDEDPVDVGPQVPGVVSPPPFSSKAEGLAGVSRKDEIHCSTPRAAVEGSQIRPHRRCSQVFLLHARRQDFAARGFDLHVADCSSVWNSKVDTEVKSCDTGTEGQHSWGT